MLESHPYDVNVKGDKHITEENITRIESSLSGKDSFVFAMISDTQREYDETAKAVKAINNHGGIDFVVHGGDLWGYS